MTKKILKSIFGMPTMIVLLSFMALSSGMATFIENDFGPLGAKSFVYGQTWFETIMLLLTLGVIANIIWFKMYKKDKLFILLIHLSLVFIFIGAALTRYFGYEAYITIPENSFQNKMYSSDEFIQIEIQNKSNTITYDEKVLMTPLSQTSFSYETKIDKKPVQIEFKKYIKNAIDKIIPVEGKEPIINVIVTEFNKRKSIDLKNKNIKSSQFLNFSLNSNTNQDKPSVNFYTDKNSIFFKTNLSTSYYDKGKTKVIKPNKKIPLQKNTTYKIGQTEFVIPEATVSGVVKTVSSNYFIPKEKQLDALIFDLTYKNKTRQISVFGKGGSTKGINKSIKLDKNTTLNLQWGTKELTLPFSILLNDFRLHRYPGSNSPSSYESDIKIYDSKNNTTLNYTIYMNNTLDYRGYRFFQSSYTEDESATILSVNKDPGKVPTYIGYFLLFVGLIISLFAKKGRFRKLATKRFTKEKVKETYFKNKMLMHSFLIISTICFIPNTLTANSTIVKSNPKILNINKKHATKFGNLLIQDYQGRIKPINSLNIEIMNKITTKKTLFNLDENQAFLSMMLYPEVWKKISFIKIKNDKLKDFIQVSRDKNSISFNDIYTKDGTYKLQYELESSNKKNPKDRTKYDKQLIKLDERLNIVYALFRGDFLRAFPKIEDKNNKWLNVNEALNLLITKNSEDIKKLMQNYYFDLKQASLDKSSWDKATLSLLKIKQYQRENAPTDIMPNEYKVKAEIFFNHYNIFERLVPFYLILGFILLILVFVKIFKTNLSFNKITTLILSILVIAFILHTAGLILRWYVAGHAPWSNGYESMIYIAWAIILSGILFSKQSVLALATTTILSGITLFVAHLSWLEPQITTLTPVLKSYWLTIHVSVITASYGFLGLSALLGFITLVLFSILNQKKENEVFFNTLTSIKEASRINEMSLMIGLVLLVIGNFLGGIWANESWGRYWGWDPKETWTLVSIIIYVIIIHLRCIKGLFNDYVLALLSMLSYFSIIMTYFGVNYYLSGKHSYVSGDYVPMPDFVPIILFIIFITIIFSYRNIKVV